jgi:hypothetical protein
MLAAAHKFVNDEVNFKGVASVITAEDKNELFSSIITAFD